MSNNLTPQKGDSDSFLAPYKNRVSKWISDLNIKPYTIIFVEGGKDSW